jgi:hypothetical protein
MWQIKMTESKQDSVKVSMIEIRGYPLLVDLEKRRREHGMEFKRSLGLLLRSLIA